MPLGPGFRSANPAFDFALFAKLTLVYFPIGIFGQLLCLMESTGDFVCAKVILAKFP